jgi:hypothetical protein
MGYPLRLKQIMVAVNHQQKRDELQALIDTPMSDTDQPLRVTVLRKSLRTNSFHPRCLPWPV